MPAFLETVRFYIFPLFAIAMTATTRAIPLQGQTAMQTWSEWSEWTACSKTCDAGISTQTRSCLSNCNNNGTLDKRYQSCCIQECIVKSVGGETQCKRLNLPGNWTSISTSARSCTVTCKHMTSDPSNVTTVQVTAALGTACQTDFGGKGTCLETHCAPVGCNSILGSKAVEDKCLQCSPVTGQECLSYSSNVPVTLHSLALTTGRVSVLKLPPHATTLNISHPLRQDGSRLAVRSLHEELIFQGGGNATSFKAAGTQFHYFIHSSLSGDREELLAAGPLESGLTIQLHGITVKTINSPEQQHVLYKYFLLQASIDNSQKSTSHTHNTSLLGTGSDRQLFYMWQYVPLFQCSVTCGNGVQTFVARCVDRDYRNRLLVDAFCLQRGLMKPLAMVKLCHIHDCPPMWVSGRWSMCSQECDGGTQDRHVGCQKFVEEGSRPDVIVDESRCGLESRPAEQQACNTGTCHARWTAGKWSPCPDHMTEGLQYRDVECSQVKSGSVTDHTHCKADLRPASTRNCRLKNCENGRCCRWVPNHWKTCDTACGSGSQSRNLHCLFTDNNNETDSSCCDGLSEPEKEQQCWSTAGAGCTPTWMVGVYGECTGRCCNMASQLQRRLVECIVHSNNQTLSLPDEACTDHKPSTSSPCTLTGCPHWNTSDWGACSPPVPPTCGLRTRGVHCVKEGREVDAEECCHVQPLEAESCYPCDLSTPASTPRCEGPDVVSFCGTLLLSFSCNTNDYLVQICCGSCLDFWASET